MGRKTVLIQTKKVSKFYFGPTSRNVSKRHAIKQYQITSQEIGGIYVGTTFADTTRGQPNYCIFIVVFHAKYIVRKGWPSKIGSFLVTIQFLCCNRMTQFFSAMKTTQF